MTILFKGERRTFRYKIHDIDPSDRSLGVEYRLPRYKRMHYTVLNSMDFFIKQGKVYRA